MYSYFELSAAKLGNTGNTTLLDIPGLFVFDLGVYTLPTVHWRKDSAIRRVVLPEGQPYKNFKKQMRKCTNAVS